MATEKKRRVDSMHSHDSDHAPVQDLGPQHRPILADGKGLNGIGHGDDRHYTDILRPAAPQPDGSTEATSYSTTLGETHAVDNTMGIHDVGVHMGKRPGSKRRTG